MYTKHLPMKNKNHQKLAARDGNYESPWQQNLLANEQETTALPSGKIPDFLIVGGGITGLTAASLHQQKVLQRR